MKEEEELAIIILAAGQSKRLGRAKQLVNFNDSNLLQHTINQCSVIKSSVKLLVLGHQRSEIEASIKAGSFEIVDNQDYKNGLSSSIQAGIRVIERNYQQISTVMFVVCDQPFLTSDHLQQLISSHSSPIITASGYANTFGVPMIVPERYWPLIRRLTADQGIKSIITEEVNLVLFPKGEIDIDTEQQITELNKN